MYLKMNGTYFEKLSAPMEAFATVKKLDFFIGESLQWFQFLLGNMFPESYGFVAMPVTSCIKDTCSNIFLSNYWRETKLFELVTSTTTKPWLSRNMIPNRKTCEKGWSNFSENFRVIALKLLELTRYASPNQSIYFNFLRCWGSFVCWYF